MTEDLEYCDTIYRRFVERRAHSLLLTVRDWEQILTWREREVPVAVVLRVIDRNVEKADGEGRPLRLTELGPAVRSAWLELRKAQVGREEGTPEELASFSLSFALSRIVEPAAEKLRSELPEGPLGAAVAEVLEQAIGRLRRRSLTSLSVEQLLGWEGRVNRRLLETAESMAEPEVLEEARRRATESAGSASGRTAELLSTKLYQMGLRRLLNLPRLRLFATA